MMIICIVHAYYTTSLQNNVAIYWVLFAEMHILHFLWKTQIPIRMDLDEVSGFKYHLNAFREEISIYSEFTFQIQNKKVNDYITK